ncbi:MAG: DUF192 domain-containing protein [bacterium]|nr:DUF192 domain-containing protein [bacterium]
MIKRSIFVIIVFLVFIIVAIVWNIATQDDVIVSTSLDVRLLTIVGHNFEVEIADTIASRTKGLSGREQLADNRGMYFIFDKPAIYSFWMKGMNFPLDIIWISDNRVVGFMKNALPDDSDKPDIYTAPGLVDRVLEINAGLVERLDIRIGDVVDVKVIQN